MILQKVKSGIPEKYVSEPSIANAMGNLIIGVKKYKNAIRWKEHCIVKDNKISDNSTLSNNLLTKSKTNTSTNS